MSKAKLIALLNNPNVKIKGIFANPPYNDKSVQENSNHHKQSTRLHVKFMEEIAAALIMAQATPPKHMRVICPASGWWIHNHGKGGAAKKLVEAGLYKVEKLDGQPFPNAYISNIGIFHLNFGDQYPEKVEDGFASTIPLPAYSLIDAFDFYAHPTSDSYAWRHAEHKQVTNGKFTFWRNMSESYTVNDNNLCLDKTRGNWRVAFSYNYGAYTEKNALGTKKIIPPNDYLGRNAACFIVAEGSDPLGDVKAAKLLEFLASKNSNKIIATQKQSAAAGEDAFRFVDASSLRSIALNKGI